MYQNRIDKLTKSENVDAYLVTSPENLYYFSGFTGGEGALILDKENRLLFTDSRYTEQAKNEAKDFKILDTAKTPLSDFLKSLGEKKIGFEDAFCTFRTFLNYKKAAGNLSFIPASEEIDDIRMIKDDSELCKIAKAAEIADEAFSYILPRISAGRTEKEIALELEFYMLSHGASGLSFETISASGKRSALPHGVATEKLLQKGDFFTLDFGCKYQGYASDMTRTVVIGTASEKQKEIYETVLFAERTVTYIITSAVECVILLVLLNNKSINNGIQRVKTK